MVHEQETSTTLKSKVQWRGGEIAFIRKLGKSTIALLTFVGHRVPRYVHYNSVVTVVREYKRTIPACFRCGTIGHRPDLCPNPQDNRCGHCGETVAVLEDGNIAPHECTPSCIVCGGGHLTGSQDCKAKFRRLQQPANQTGQRTQPRTAVPSGPVTTSKAPTPSNKTTKGTTGPAPPAGTLPGRAPKSPRSTNPKASRDPHVPTFQDGDFPALQGPPSGAPKNTSQRKSTADPLACTTNDCKYLAQWLRVKIDRKVDPCHDFYKFVCDDYKDYNSLNKVTFEVMRIAQSAAHATTVPATGQTAWQKATALFKACLTMVDSKRDEFHCPIIVPVLAMMRKRTGLPGSREAPDRNELVLHLLARSEVRSYDLI
ncbi:hypothetical protein HPB49_021507 [Dermacentor silvarum]|uniref:Uncharacterized protein n=1 Tax=Dermacentor silvarum TaxID=543639 RepID=A0ACB8D884_DERSI|nr:hypothetical protein HPB49_021507 [Dermacentor silvarum]